MRVIANGGRVGEVGALNRLSARRHNPFESVDFALEAIAELSYARRLLRQPGGGRTVNGEASGCRVRCAKKASVTAA